ncbi:RES family NAD+ phosphorylase [Poseidonibacter lekithochrous]|uniref:RES family NAD+ phosphorylase n=1 Tax=Poseidonibacter lekithochrous TaxID=1904463 RepID=UPI00196A5A39|nr:RES family NAD+ phosphorylase [Poseidonibacter lekithochrous]
MKLEKDIKLIENIIKIGFFYYGPRLWMVGEIEPLKELINKKTRNNIIQRIIEEYPTKLLSKNDKFYRLRINPSDESKHNEYDSPPKEFLKNGRFDSKKLPILYASQDVEVCIHECRVTVEDNLYLATLIPSNTIKLLDLTEIIEDNETEFESLDLAIHMLFYAGKHSYKISRAIARELEKQNFDGIIYPSYFSVMRTGAMPFETVYGMSIRKIETLKNHAKSQVIPNIALFGRPIKEKKVIVSNINKLILNKINYDFGFGPIEY